MKNLFSFLRFKSTTNTGSANPGGGRCNGADGSDDDDNGSMSVLGSLPRFPAGSGRNRQTMASALTRPQTVHSRSSPLGNDDDGGRGSSQKTQAARVILAEAALLPLVRRHELLAAAARLSELAPLFQPPVSRSATNPRSGGGVDGGGSRKEPLRDNFTEPAEMRSKIRQLAEAVKTSPCPARIDQEDQVESPTAPPVPPAPPVPVPTPTPAVATLKEEACGADVKMEEEEEGQATMEAREAREAKEGTVHATADALAVSVVPEYEQYGREEEEVRAVVSLKAISEVPKRAQVALTCVLDRSGSMSGEPIRLVRETVHFLIDQLTDGDCLGLISYAGSVREDLPLLRMTPAGRAMAHLVVEGLRADGSTALYEGLVAGVRQQMSAEAELRGDGSGACDAAASRVVHSCFLFTDGQATDGPSTPSDIISGLQALQGPSGHHVTVHTFGFGSGHSVDLLQRVADAQSGVYYYISCTDDIACGFGDALGGLLAVVATSVQVEVRPRPGVTLTAFRSGGRVLNNTTSATSAAAATQRPTSGGCSRAAQADGGGGAVPTGATFNDVFAEETRECLVVMKLPAATTVAADTDSELMEVELQYTDVATGARVVRTAVLRVRRCAEPRPAGQLPAELVFVTAARFETLDAIEAAQRAAVAGPINDVSGAHKVLDEQLGRLAAAPLQVPALSVLAEQTKLARASITPRMLMDQGSCAAVAGTMQTLKQQRTATSTISSTQYFSQYDTKSKSAARQSARAAVSSSAWSCNPTPKPPKGRSS